MLKWPTFDKVSFKDMSGCSKEPSNGNQKIYIILRISGKK